MSGAPVEQQLWNAVDAYITERLIPQDAVLDGVLQASAAAGLPAINVAPNQGKLLMLLAKLQGARQILEIGTLGGYSTIWLARAVAPGGRVVTLEADPKHAEVARSNFALAGLAGVIDLRLGPALDTLPQLAAEGRGPLRSHLHRRRQTEHRGLFQVGAQAVTARQRHHRGQRRAQGRACRPRQR